MLNSIVIVIRSVLINISAMIVSRIYYNCDWLKWDDSGKGKLNTQKIKRGFGRPTPDTFKFFEVFK